MLKRLLTVALILGATNSFAATSSDSTVSTQMNQNLLDSTTVAKGFKVGLAKNNFDLKSKAELMGQKFSAKEDADQNIGILIGYAQIPVNAIGFNANLVYDTYDTDEGDDPATLRAMANLTLGINTNLFLQGGLNLQKITKGIEGEMKKEMAYGAGIQVGGGVQITKNFGADLLYVYTQHTGDIDVEGLSEDIKMTVIFSGLQLAVTGTF